MRKGFIFNHQLCVRCLACSAACMLENKWEFNARTIYSHNADAFLPDPVLNLSMACNHCHEPACLKGCPSSSYFKSKPTGAVIIDPEKCLGCRYCLWNCPYDAPKFNDREGVVKKCHWCHQRLEADLEPACSASCPTGALSFGEIPDLISFKEVPWLPEKDFNPSLYITGKIASEGPSIVPALPDSITAMEEWDESTIVSGEWSLIFFTFLSTVSVALTITGLFNDQSSPAWSPLALLSAAAMFSVFHLGKKVNIWRAVMNMRSSPLSREIGFSGIYFLLLFAGLFFDNNTIRIASSLAGLSLLFSIDQVYTFSAKDDFYRIHSGQSMISGLLTISFLIWIPLPFLFLAVVKLISGARLLRSQKEDITWIPVRIFRIALLIISSAMILTGIGKGTAAGIIIFLSGEFIDRMLFYADFQPYNLAKAIHNSKIDRKNEKERG